MPTLSPEARLHRRDLDELARLAENDLRLLLRPLSDPTTARDALMDTLPRLLNLYGSAAGTLGAEYYDEKRDRLEVRGRFTANPVDLPGSDRTDALARWGVEPLYQAEPDFVTTLSKVAGGMQRLILDADRQTIRTSAVADRRAGWMRVGEGECDWCEQYLDGEVHYVAGYDFDAHDRCRCTAEPVFD
jgi:hypothetical protein